MIWVERSSQSRESLSSGKAPCNFTTARTSSSKIEKQNKHIQSCFYPVVKVITRTTPEEEQGPGRRPLKTQ
ncbi:hypothetical protein Y1Q_0007382 [Alligator mississippiensis]|uniref:Uncharacterized protein n=1 Tax=Alligator mississippiensis TaxID=8496 RepID=A0A151P8M6_ALLMI|nr:hypothetical protein Y1Q_0007382 [Alligator mississippiensis]